MLDQSNQFPYYSTIDPNADSIYITASTGENITIGRNESSSMLIPDNTVSRKHASISFVKDEFIISDSNSKFGTRIWEKDIEVPLHRNRMVGMEVGNTVFSLKKIK